MATFLRLILFIIATTFAGWNIILLFDRKGVFGWPEKAGLSYLFGIGAISLEMFIMGLFGFEFVTTCILTPWILLFLFNALRYYRMNETNTIFKKPDAIPSAKFRVSEKMLLSLLSFQVIYTFFKALANPIESYDSVSIWALKAKILYLAKTIPADFFHMINASFHGIHADYPMLLPFSEAWFYTFLGNFNDYLVKVLFPLNFLAVLLVFYSLLKKITKDRKTSLLFTFILASVKQFGDYAVIGYADLQMAIYCFLAFVFIYMWIETKSGPYLAASVISCVFTVWTKNEGIVISLIAAALLTASLKKPPYEAPRFVRVREARRAILILFILCAAWLGFKASLGLENDVINLESFKHLSISELHKRMIPIAYEYQKHVFGFKKWNLAWIIFLYFVIARFKNSFAAYRYITIPISAILSAYTLMYMITPHDIHWHLNTSASRLLLHALPLIIFFVALNINDVLNGKYTGGA